MENPIREELRTLNQLEHDLENMLTYCLQIFENGDEATKRQLAKRLPTDLLWSVSIKCSLHRPGKQEG